MKTLTGFAFGKHHTIHTNVPQTIHFLRTVHGFQIT